MYFFTYSKTDYILITYLNCLIQYSNQFKNWFSKIYICTCTSYFKSSLLISIYKYVFVYNNIKYEHF